MAFSSSPIPRMSKLGTRCRSEDIGTIQQALVDRERNAHLASFCAVCKACRLGCPKMLQLLCPENWQQ